MSQEESLEARVATFNLLHGQRIAAPGEPSPGEPADANGPADPADLVKAAQSLNADILGLQEVDRLQERSGGVDQVELMAEAIGSPHWRFAPALHGTPGVDAAWTPATAEDGRTTVGPTYGIGMVSRWPVRRWWVRRFSAAPFSLPLLVPGTPKPQLLRIPDEPRLALAALVDSPAGTFTAVTCHLSFVPGYNWKQLRDIARWVARMPAPVLVLGDLNLPGALPRAATGWTSLAQLRTYPAQNPRVQFDHVLGLGVEPADVLDARATRMDISDHCALVVDLALGRALERAGPGVSTITRPE